ncbi:Rab-GTPase-TBC domain [Phytophthora cactorum]|nr:Rab-GTPase-TBC domain [Phytophthora cactorum]
MDAAPSDVQLRQQYDALLAGDSITADYERWRELKRLVIVHGLPRDEGVGTDVEASSNASLCSLRGRVWKAFLGVESNVDMTKYAALVGRGASHYDGDIRNDTFRTFRGDLEFAQRVPEEKLVRLLNVFINELGSNPGEEKQEDGENARNGNLPSIRWLDPDLYRHLSSRGITARIYALPLILSLFACVPPLHELLRVWDVVRFYAFIVRDGKYLTFKMLNFFEKLFAVGVHFVVVLAVAHTVLLREQLLKLDMDLMKVLSLRCAPPLQSDLLISVALQLLHRLPEELLYEIARHPFENPDAPTSLPFHPKTISAIATQVRKQQEPQPGDAVRTPRSSTSSRGPSTKDKPAAKPSTPRQPSCSSSSRAETTLSGHARPPWKI